MRDYCKGCPGKYEETWDCGECGIEKRFRELQEENPTAVIVPPGEVKAIDGKTYYNEMFIIAK